MINRVDMLLGVLMVGSIVSATSATVGEHWDICFTGGTSGLQVGQDKSQ